MLQEIFELSQSTNKNILIIGSARSGTHALGSQLSAMSSDYQYLGEICTVDHRESPWEEINVLTNTARLKIAHLVAYSSKIRLSGKVKKIKETSVIVSLRRQDKVKQFASWIYFHLNGGINNGSWHNHKVSDTSILPGSFTVSNEQIDQFITEQLIDNFFCADIVLNYEELLFEKSKINKNQYKFDLPEIFSNLDLVHARLKDWKYPDV